MPLKELPELHDLPKYNLQDWLQAVTESMKKGSIEDLIRQKYGLEIKPFLDANTSRSSVLRKAKKEWIIGVRVDSDSDSQLNKEIRYFLNLGAESISVQLKDEYDLVQVFDEVKSAYIYSDISNAPLLGSQELEAIFGKDSTGFLAQQSEILPRFHSILFSSDASDPVEALTSICQQVFQVLKSGQTAINQIRIELSLDAYIPVAVAKIRAMRILWLNVLKVLGQKLQPAFISCNIISDKPDANSALIDLSVRAMNAVVGGCDLLYLDGVHFDQNQRRLAMNIQHVMKMESKLHLVQDPLAGAYVIEDLTAQMANTVWSKLSF